MMNPPMSPRMSVSRLVAVSCLVTGIGCNNYLSGPKLNQDPNNPTQATIPSLFSSVQVALWSQMESGIPRLTCIWMQQCSAQTSIIDLGTYSTGGGNTWNFAFTQTYGGGGLIDLRRIEHRSLAIGDSAYAGVAAVMEVMYIALAADVWGDIPYTQAADSAFATPVLDPQQQVYAHLQAKLDSAITWLAATSVNSVGPGGDDPVYGGDPGKWTRLAHTLKARLYLHTAEVVGASAYASALAETNLGLATGEDYKSHHTTIPTQSNAWYQYTATQFPGDLAAGKFLVDLLKASGDPLLPVYFALDGNGDFAGADPGQALDPGHLSGFGPRVSPDTGQPIVLAEESALIRAEAQYQTNPALGLATLDSVRAARGLAPLAPAPAGPAILEAIITEKYIVLFQNPEAWNDYKRTCYPRLTPYVGATAIPGRLPYPPGERDANPHVPGLGPVRNWNDPNGC
jgi:hypothetical protein